jgi:hypothetical protein
MGSGALNSELIRSKENIKMAVRGKKQVIVELYDSGGSLEAKPGGDDIVRSAGLEAVMTDLWVAKPVRLEYRLGEIPLFVVKFPALEFDAHFTSLTTNLDETRPPFTQFSSEVEAIFIRSHPINGELPRLEFLSQAIRYVPEQYYRHYVNLQGSFQKYLSKFSGKSRSTLQRKVRKFSEFCGGELRWREYCRRDEMEEFYSLSREVSEKTYQERLLNLGFPDGDEFKQELGDMAARDLVRGYILFFGEKPIAYLYCPVREGILFYQYLGYDPEFRNWSPGTVLQYLVLERLFSEGKFKMFDFTDGEGSHKEFFSTGSTRCADVYFLRPTLRNLLLLRLHSGLRTLSGTTVKTLDRLGVKSRIKRFIRQWGHTGKSHFTGNGSSGLWVDAYLLLIEQFFEIIPVYL